MNSSISQGLSVAALALAASSGAALAQPGDSLYYGHHHMMGGWFSGLVMMVLFVALIVGAVVVTFRLLGYGSGGRTGGRALDILTERFARGEIDRAEFEERRKALQDDSSR